MQINGNWAIYGNDSGKKIAKWIIDYTAGIIWIDWPIYKWVMFVIFTWGQFWPSGIVVACFCLCPSVHPCVNHELVRVITHHPFKLGSPNLYHRCKRPWLRSLLFWGGDWPWPSRSNLTLKSKFIPFWASPCHNSPPIEVTISKFGRKMHLSTVQIPTNFEIDLQLNF